jgi:hypothetical protein
MHMGRGGDAQGGGGGMHVHPVHPPWVRHCPRSGMGKNQDPESGIRDKHPGSATLVATVYNVGTFIALFSYLLTYFTELQAKHEFYPTNLCIQYCRAGGCLVFSN